MNSIKKLFKKKETIINLVAGVVVFGLFAAMFLGGAATVASLAGFGIIIMAAQL